MVLPVAVVRQADRLQDESYWRITMAQPGLSRGNKKVPGKNLSSSPAH